MDFSPLLAFSGSAGFGTWMDFVPLFWGLLADTSLYPCYFWILELFVWDFIYSV
jgi:hypothetical protein